MSRPGKILIALGIIAFWAVMTGWLVKTNWNDGNAPFSDLSPTLVLQQLLKHEVSSQLGIYRGKHRLGAITITPIHNPGNSISLDGNIALAEPGEKPKTVRQFDGCDYFTLYAHLNRADVKDGENESVAVPTVSWVKSVRGPLGYYTKGYLKETDRTVGLTSEGLRYLDLVEGR